MVAGHVRTRLGLESREKGIDIVPKSSGIGRCRIDRNEKLPGSRRAADWS
jgi:hypothetical protein